MRIIHGGGYTDEDKRSYAKLVFQNIYLSMQTMIRAMETLHLSFSDSRNQVRRDPPGGFPCLAEDLCMHTTLHLRFFG